MIDWRVAGLENFGVFQPYITDGRFEIPTILPEKLPTLEWMGFNYARGMKGTQPETGVHFFVDDYQFRAVWENPVRYADVMSRFGAVLTPDFSTYVDMPQILQMEPLPEALARGVLAVPGNGRDSHNILERSGILGVVL